MVPPAGSRRRIVVIVPARVRPPASSTVSPSANATARLTASGNVSARVVTTRLPPWEAAGKPPVAFGVGAPTTGRVGVDALAPDSSAEGRPHADTAATTTSRSRRAERPAALRLHAPLTMAFSDHTGHDSPATDHTGPHLQHLGCIDIGRRLDVPITLA